MSDYQMLFEKLFELIGKVFFPRQQAWERCRNAKIMVAAAVVSLVLGLILWQVFEVMNRIKK